MAGFTEFRVEGESEAQMICTYLTLHYLLPDRTKLPVEQVPAWCARCALFVAAEYLPTIEELQIRLFELRSPSQMVHFVYGNDLNIELAIAELEVRLDWRQTRVAPPRCLMCGSTEITPIRFDSDGTCTVMGKRLKRVGAGWADTADWIADFAPDGMRLPEHESKQRFRS